MPCRGVRINRSLTVSGVGSFGINIHIGKDFIKVKYSKSNRFVIFIVNDRSSCFIK